MIKYEIYTGQYSTDARIREVECIRETNKFVVIMEDWGSECRERKMAKRSDWKSYHDTWEEAHKELLQRSKDRVHAARERLKDEEAYYNSVVVQRK